MTASDHRKSQPTPDLTALRYRLWYQEKGTRVSAAHALAGCGPAAVETLSRAAAEADAWEIREAAVQSLGVIGGREAVQALCGALADRHERVRLAAANALALVGDETAIEPLSTTLRRSFTGGSGRLQTFSPTQ